MPRKNYESRLTYRKRLHEAVYKELRAKYPSYPSHCIYTAITQALAIFESYRRLSRESEKVSPPRAENLNTILLDDTHLFWFSWGSLKLATRRRYIIIPFNVHEHSKKFAGWKVKGSRLVRKGGSFFLHVTFRKAVEEKMAEGILGIDVNEKSVDLAVVKPENVRFIEIDVSDAKCIRGSTSRRGRTNRAKYWER